MKFLSQPIRAALLFAAVLFGLQSLQLLYAPSFYIASLHQVHMPPFMVGSFVRHFALIAGLYLVWGLFLGSLNALAARLGDAKAPPTWLHFFGFFLLAASQSLALYELIVWEFPSVLGFLPLFESQSLLRSYGVIAVLGCGLFLSAMLFLQVKRFRELSFYAAALLLPALLHLPLMGVSSLELPQASRFSPDKPKVLLLGFDALDGDSGNPVIEARTRNLNGRIFNQAFTPLPSTHPAWHSVLSGLYPERHGVRFFFDSPLEPAEPGLYLQNRLKKDFGAGTLFASDQPETSYFTEAQGFDAAVAPEFGWRAHLTSIFLNQFLFPALWLNNGLVENLWGYSLNSPSVYNYDLARFFNFSFQKFSQLPEEARFMALHSCHLHSPLRLRREELASIEGYLTLAPRDFSYWRWAKPGDPLSRSPARWKNPYFLRKPKTLQFLGDLIEELKAKHYFEGHRIAFLSDHGERFVEGYEIYGGIHGIDLKTREQNNVVLALFAPQIEGMAEVETPVSLIDVAPTLLGLLGEKDLGTYDGAALFDSQGRYTAPPWRRLRLESTGLIAPEKWAGSFPQIPAEELESDLSYQPNGAVRVGADYYRLILQRKEFLNLDQIPEVLVRRKAGDEKGTSARLGLE